MEDYNKLYHMLFNAITDALEALEDGRGDLAKAVLIGVQQNAEEVYISSGK